MKKISRYWHTLRHLRPVQFYGRIWFRLVRPSPDARPAPPVRAHRGPWVTPARREASLTGPRTFRFLGETGDLSEIGWDGVQREKLWRYNQHYFDDLNAAGADTRTEWHLWLLRDWVRANPPAAGNGWEPYPLSLRIVNWVKWALAGRELPPECVHSLAVQARWLMRRLEVHLLGNHLFANAKALVFAGLFFDGAEASRWLATGLRLLAREVPEQVLPDGGHFELSTMYHAIALDDMLDLCNLLACHAEQLVANDRRLLEGWRRTAVVMQSWLHVMCHPDGEIAFFNDAAMGIAPAPKELDSYAARLELPRPAASRSRCLPFSGYARLERDGAVALLDLARVGPDYLPGHAHADTLSFELSVGGNRLLVNSGTSCYGASPERLRQRGTAAHNTVIVDGADSSEVWSGFRVARRARPHGTDVDLAGDVLRARASHDGYARLPGRPVHQREWLMTGEDLLVHDRVPGRADGAEARFHFHPQVRLHPGESATSGSAIFPDGRTVKWTVQRGQPRIEASTWHPRFGVAEPNACLSIRLQEGESTLRLQWS